MVGTTPSPSIVDRMIRAARLETQVYEEVEHDQSATGQAMLVVVVGAIAAGIGALAGGIIGVLAAINEEVIYSEKWSITAIFLIVFVLYLWITNRERLTS